MLGVIAFGLKGNRNMEEGAENQDQDQVSDGEIATLESIAVDKTDENWADPSVNEETRQRRSISWTWIKEKLSAIYAGLIKMSIFIVILTILIPLVRDIYQERVIFIPFEVPAELKKKGYNGTVVVKKLKDRIGDFRIGGSLALAIFSKDPKLENQENALKEGPDIQIPGTGVSLRDLVTYLRKALCKPYKRVDGEITIIKNQEKLQLTIRVQGAPGENFIEDIKGVEALIEKGAEYVLKILDPLTLGRYYYWKRDLKSMKELVAFIWKSGPSSQERAVAYLIEGYIHFEEKDLDRALEAWETAVFFDPNAPEPYTLKGIVLDIKGKYKDAITQYKNALTHDPEYLAALNNWGIALCKLDRRADAIAKFRKTLEINPDYAEAYNNIGCVMVMEKRYNKAIGLIKEAVNLDLDNPIFYESWAEALTGLKRYDDAIIKYKKVVELDPDGDSGKAARKSINALTGKKDQEP